MEITDDLLINFLLGEATKEEVKQIREWLSKDLANQQQFDQFQLIWQSSQNLKFKGEIDAQASLERLKHKVKAQQTTVAEAKTSSFNTGYWIRVAAVLTLLAGGTWFYIINFSNQQVQFLTQEIVKADTLSDGSVVTLNKNSTLLYPKNFQRNERQVWLKKGEAFFSVTPDKTKPFLINSGKAIIRVVGTSFNVKNKNGDVEVIVETGIVKVSQNNKTVTLSPGEKVMVKHDNGEMTKVRNPDHLYNYYRSKEFVADDTSLWRMVEVLNEAYNSHIIIGRKELNNLPLNTTFKNESLEDILQVISRTFKIKIERKHNQVILY